MKTAFTTIFVARGLTVLVMPAIHTVMMYSRPDVYQSWWTYVLRFFAEGPGAQLFMFLMGFFLATGKRKSARAILTRSFLLLISGYMLNFFRIYLPACLGLLPDNMLHHYDAGAGPYPYLPLLLTGDILQFAGMAYGITGLVAHHQTKCIYVIFIYLMIAASSPFMWGIRSEKFFLDHLLALICGNDHRAFFPLFPWLCYPMAGLVTGIAFDRSGTQHFFNKMGMIGIVLLVTGIGILSITPARWDTDFYRSSIGKTMAYTGFVMCWLFLIHWIIQLSPPRHLVIRILSFCSRHITIIYLLHWIIVCWCIPLTGYHQLNRWQTLFAICFISILSFGTVFLLSKRKPFFSIAQV